MGRTPSALCIFTTVLIVVWWRVRHGLIIGGSGVGSILMRGVVLEALFALVVAHGVLCYLDMDVQSAR